MEFSPRAAALLLVPAALTLACGTGSRAASQTGAPTSASVEVAAPEPDALDKAQVAILTRAPVEARRHLTAVLAAEPEHPLALFLLANVALEEGHLDEAAQLTARLQVHAPGGEAAVLKALVEARRAQTPWRQALIRAWHEAGRPDLRRSELLQDPARLFEFPPGLAEKAAHTADPSERALLSILTPGEQSAAQLAALLPELSEPDIAWVVMGLLRTLPPAFPESQTYLDAVRRHANAMAEQHPGTAQFGLIALLIGSEDDTPFSTSDLDTLERLSHLPISNSGELASVYALALRVYQEAGVPLADGVAFDVASSMLNVAADSLLLRRRTQATWSRLSEPERQRLAGSLWRFGGAMGASTTLLDRMAGEMLMKRAADLMKDPAKSAEASARHLQSQEVYKASRALDFWREWPLPSMREAFMAAHAEAEFETMREYASPAPSSETSPAPH